VSLHRGIDGRDPVRPDPIFHEERRLRSRRLATGTLACPVCDAPVAPAGTMAPADPVGCPYCHHVARVRDFLSLEHPSRPAHVEVRVVPPAA
jgi:hypothetical protein